MKKIKERKKTDQRKSERKEAILHVDQHVYVNVRLLEKTKTFKKKKKEKKKEKKRQTSASASARRRSSTSTSEEGSSAIRFSPVPAPSTSPARSQPSLQPPACFLFFHNRQPNFHNRQSKLHNGERTSAEERGPKGTCA
eukprot:29708-Rhodomonas_salina.1